MDAMQTCAQHVPPDQPFSVLLGVEITHYSDAGGEMRLPITSADHAAAWLRAELFRRQRADLCQRPPLGRADRYRRVQDYDIRPAQGDALVARAKAISSGKTQSVIRCQIYAVTDGTEHLCAAAQGTTTVTRGMNATGASCLA